MNIVWVELLIFLWSRHLSLLTLKFLLSFSSRGWNPRQIFFHFPRGNQARYIRCAKLLWLRHGFLQTFFLRQIWSIFSFWIWILSFQNLTGRIFKFLTWKQLGAEKVNHEHFDVDDLIILHQCQWINSSTSTKLNENFFYLLILK